MFCSVLWVCYLIFALSFLFRRGVRKGNPNFIVKFYNSLKYTHSPLQSYPPSLSQSLSLSASSLSLPSHCSSLHSWKREISVIICGCFSYSCFLSYRNPMYSQDIPSTPQTHRSTATLLQKLHFAFWRLLKCHKREYIYNRR